jgi:hypothetical protein
VGKQASARNWAALLVVAQGGREISDDSGFRSRKRGASVLPVAICESGSVEPRLACFGGRTRMSQIRNEDSLHLRRAVQINWRVTT